MSAEAVGRFMPAVITLDDLAAMIAADTRPLSWLVQTSAAEPLAAPR